MPRAGATRQSVTVVLSCLHSFTSTVKPRKGDVIYCTRCERYVGYMVAELPAEEGWSTECLTCNRLKGTGQVTAETRAASHALRLPGHDVVIKRGGKIVRRVRHDTPTLDDIPPF